jgi:hypothetical protein
MKGSRALALSASVRVRMSPLRLHSVLFVLALLAAGSSGCKRRSTVAPATDYAQPLRLDFRPPVDRDLSESVTVSMQRGAGGPAGAAPIATDPAEPPADGVTLTTVSRFSREGQAWVLEQRTGQVQLRRGGAAVDSPLATLLQRIPLRVQLARDGAFVRVLDAERGEVELAESGLDEATREALREVIGADALQERVRREWTAKYGGLFGRNLQLGQKLYALEAVPVEGSERSYVLERTLSGTLLTDYGEALVFTLRCLGEAAPDAPAEVRALLSAPGAPQLEPSVSCDGEQVIARGTFVPVRSHLTVRVSGAPAGAGGAAEVWTWSRRTAAQELDD